MNYTPFRASDNSIPYTQGAQGKTPPKHLTPPALIPEFFLGREANLNAIHHKLATNNLLVLVSEQGGIGKTTLAAKYWEVYQGQYQHMAWVYAGNGLIDALLTLALPLELHFHPPLLQQERIVHLLGVLRKLRKPILLAIDNLIDPEELIHFYDDLRSCRNVHFLVTTRVMDFEKAKFHTIQPLDAGLVTALFLHHFPQHPSSQQRLLTQMYQAVGYNTLVAKLLAGTLHTLNHQLSEYYLNNLLRDLQNKGLLELRQTTNTMAEKSAWLRQEAPETLIGALYDLVNFGAAEKKLLSAFVVLPAEPIAFGTLSLLLDQTETLEKDVAALVEKGWLEWDQTHTLSKISPVVQECLLKKKGTLRENCQELIEGLGIQLEQLNSRGRAKNTDLINTTAYVRYASSVALNFTEIDEDLTFLRDCLDTFYFHTDSPFVALDRYKTSCEIEKQRYENDPDDAIAKNRLCVVYLDLAKTYNLVYEQELAFDCIKKAIQLGRELWKKYPDNPDFKSNLAIAHWMLGDLNYKLDNYQAASGDYKAAERLWAELVTTFPDYAEFNENLEKMRTRIEKLRGVGSIKEKTFELLSTIYDYLTRGRYR